MELGVLIIYLLFNDKVKDTITGHITDKIFAALHDKLMPSKVEKAFNKALEKWSKNSDIRNYHYGRRFQTIQEFANYLINRQELNNKSDSELFNIFEEELRKDSGTYQLLLELREQAIQNGIDKIILDIQSVNTKLENQVTLLSEIKNYLSTFNKGKRTFEAPENYIQRTCMVRIGNNDFISYHLNSQKCQVHSLLDFVKGNTDCKENKFILYSDAQSGKSTELQKLGWDLQEEGNLLPVLFEVKGHPQLSNDLPALSEEQDKNVVLIIDALDERFDSEKRYDLYNSIKSYADEHSNLHIVLSCRSNFGSECSLENFVALTLNDLSLKDAYDYINTRGCYKLKEEIDKKRVNEFIRTPFYLIALVDYYTEKQTLPNNKSDLYDFFINRRLQQEDDKNIKKTSYIKRKGYYSLQKIAIAIQLMNVNDLSDNEILDLEDESDEQLDRVLHSGLLVETTYRRYAFIHNAFKEYLVSQFLFKHQDINTIKKICCYKDTNIIKSTWYNTIALLLSQLSQTEDLSYQIVDWIVNDNKTMVLYIDSKMFNESQRTDLFKEILEECKAKNLRFDDFIGSKYEALMDFGFSEKSISYLTMELEMAIDLDNHLVNILFLIRYLKFELLSENQIRLIAVLLFKVFITHIQKQEYAYILFAPFENHYLLCEDTIKNINVIIKNIEHPNVINNWIEYVIKANCVEQYIDIIIEKGKFVHDYNNNGCTHIVSRDNLFEAYSSVQTWTNIKKVLCQLTIEFKEHSYTYGNDRKDFEQVLTKLLQKAVGFCFDNIDNADFIYRCLFEMGGDRYILKSNTAEPYIIFFRAIEKEQYYFEKSFKKLKKQLHDWEHHDYKKLEASAYCTSLLLNVERLESINSVIEENSETGYRILSWLKDFSSLEMRKLIDDIQRTKYNSLWEKYNRPSTFDVNRQREFNELMDYESFKHAILQVVEQKTPRNKQELKKMRNVKISLTDDELDGISYYIFRFFCNFEQADETYDLNAINNGINNLKMYHRFVVSCMSEFIYNDNKSLVVSEKQHKMFVDYANEWLETLTVEDYNEEYRYFCPAITVLLHGDTKLRKDKLFYLLPYSSCKIHQMDELNMSHDFTLFEYIKNVADLKELCYNISLYYSKTYLCYEENLKLWGCYLIENGISKEYSRVIGWMLNMPDRHSAYCLILTLLNNSTTKKMVMQRHILEKCSEDKKVFIYEQLAKVKDNNEFVRHGLENEFECFGDMNKKRALHTMLFIGSMYGLKYFVEHIDVIDYHISMHYTNVEALPYMLEAYSRAIDMQSRFDYSFIINSLQEMALASTENWKIVCIELEKLIESNRKKYVHLNYYLNKWEKEIMEKCTPIMNIDEVKRLLDNCKLNVI